MKLATMVTVILASITVLVATTATAMLSSLSDPVPDFRYEDLEAGWLLPMVCGPTFRSAFPSFPVDPSCLLDIPALLFAGVSLALVGAAKLRWPMYSLTALAGGMLMLGLLPMVVGAIWLHDGTESPQATGAWLSFMLMGLLYGGCLSAALALLDLRLPLRGLGHHSTRFAEYSPHRI